MLPKYALLEIERRWLVTSIDAHVLAACPVVEIEDRYLHGTRLRLRAMRQPHAPTVFKLCKKYGKTNAHAEPITNLYLGADEYAVLAKVPAARLCKRRHALDGGSLDVFESPHTGLMIFEREFDDEAAALGYTPPVFAGAEISGDVRYAGGVLAGI